MEDLRERRAGSISSLDTAMAQIKTKGTRDLIKLYQGLPSADGGIPNRSAFRPENVRSFLPFLTLHEVPIEGSPIYRLVGARARAAFARNPIGRAYTDIVQGSRAESACASFRLCCFTPCAMLVIVDHVRKSGLRDTHEVLGLPFQSQSAETGFLLCADTVISDRVEVQGEKDDTAYHTVRERVFIDLGYGTPSDHIDLVTID